MQKTEPLSYGSFYHIFNCGINGEPLFYDNTDYERFLLFCDRYIETIADTYAWCLMGNHFHLLVRVKEEAEIGFFLPLNADRSNDSVRFKIIHYADLSEFAEPDSVYK